MRGRKKIDRGREGIRMHWTTMHCLKMNFRVLEQEERKGQSQGNKTSEWSKDALVKSTPNLKQKILERN
jgi:hypothetical protein